jgi:hypothetical protein
MDRLSVRALTSRSRHIALRTPEPQNVAIVEIGRLCGTMASDLRQSGCRLNLDELLKRMIDAATGADGVSVEAESTGQCYTSSLELEME